jgi:hypothetical protein
MLYDFSADTPMKEGNACDESGKSGFFLNLQKKGKPDGERANLIGKMARTIRGKCTSPGSQEV